MLLIHGGPQTTLKNITCSSLLSIPNVNWRPVGCPDRGLVYIVSGPTAGQAAEICHISSSTVDCDAKPQKTYNSCNLGLCSRLNSTLDFDQKWYPSGLTCNWFKDYKSDVVRGLTNLQQFWRCQHLRKLLKSYYSRLPWGHGLRETCRTTHNVNTPSYVILPWMQGHPKEWENLFSCRFSRSNMPLFHKLDYLRLMVEIAHNLNAQSLMRSRCPLLFLWMFLSVSTRKV